MSYCDGMLGFVRFTTIPPPEDDLHWEIKKEDLVSWRNMMEEN